MGWGVIDTNKIVAMIEHWLSTPPNGYFGSSYGNNLAQQLLKNTDAFTADAFLEKMKADIPILNELGDDIAIVQNHLDFERVQVYIQLGRVYIEVVVPNTNPTIEQDYYHATAS